MAIVGIFVWRCIDHPTKWPSRCLVRTSVARCLDKDSAGQWHLAFTRGTDRSKERRQISGGADTTSAVRIIDTGLWMNGKDNAAL